MQKDFAKVDYILHRVSIKEKITPYKKVSKERNRFCNTNFIFKKKQNK